LILKRLGYIAAIAVTL